MKFRTGFFNVFLHLRALPASPVASGWKRQCFAGLKARFAVGIAFVKGEGGSRPRAERRRRLSVLCASLHGAGRWEVGLRFLVRRGSSFTDTEMQLRGSAGNRLLPADSFIQDKGH